MQERMLMDLTNQLQVSIDHIQLTWLEKRDEVQPPNFKRVNTFLRNAIATREAALRKAERFVVLSNRPRSPARPSTEPPTDKLDRLGNTLKPDGNLQTGEGGEVYGLVGRKTAKRAGMFPPQNDTK